MLRAAITGLVGIVALGSSSARAQDYSVLRINEVIADNSTQLPLDLGGSTTDMVEIYNGGDETLTLGTGDPSTSLALTDTLELPEDDPETTDVDEGPWTFQSGVAVSLGRSIIVFCDGNLEQDKCEPHAGFRISSTGDEPITLWGPVIGTDPGGKPIRQIIDQIWLPPLPPDVSFGRYPDGAGPAPVPLEQVLDTFVFHQPPGSSC